jgi:hypothetical protein
MAPHDKTGGFLPPSPSTFHRLNAPLNHCLTSPSRPILLWLVRGGWASCLSLVVVKTLSPPHVTGRARPAEDEAVTRRLLVITREDVLVSIGDCLVVPLTRTLPCLGTRHYFIESCHHSTSTELLCLSERVSEFLSFQCSREDEVTSIKKGWREEAGSREGEGLTNTSLTVESETGRREGGISLKCLL